MSEPQYDQELRKAAQEAIDYITRVVNEARDAIRGAGLLPEQPPEDPRERALWLKRNRNTGPEKPKNWRKR